MANDRVLCANCKWLRTDGPCDQWYYFCGLDRDCKESERLARWYERAGNEKMRDSLDGSCEMGEVDRHNTVHLRSALDEMGIKYRKGEDWTGARSTEFTIGLLNVCVVEKDDGSLDFFASMKTYTRAKMDADDVIGLVRAILGVVKDG